MKMTNLPDLPKYVRTIEAQAARITGWADLPGGARTLSLEGGAMVDVSRTFIRMFKPQVGDYFVASENGTVRSQSAERFLHDYQAAPNPQPLAWPEIERLASMQPQVALFRTQPPEPKDAPVANAVMDMVLKTGAA